MRVGMRMALALVLAAPLSFAAQAGEAQTYSVDVVLAPIAVDGTFAVTIDTAGGTVQGTLVVDTDVRGKLAGTLQIGLLTLDVKGSVTHGKKGTRASFTATGGGERITFQGSLAGSTLVGRTNGKGVVAPGKRDFTLNLATAGPHVARIDCAIDETAKGRFSGPARVVACGETVTLAVSGSRSRRTWSLKLKAGRNFTFTGKGPPADPIVLGWSVHGFGATAKGSGLVLGTLTAPNPIAYGVAFAELETEAPIAAIPLSTAVPPSSTFTVAPALPAGLALGAGDGTITGTATELRDTATYTVTASNFAGSQQTSIQVRTRIQRAKSFAPETRPLTDDDIRHFLARTQFGVTAAEVARVKALGLDGFIDDMLIFAQNGPAEAAAAAELVNASDPVGLEGKFPGQTQLTRWWSNLMMNTDNPFQERLAFFWHDHFAAASNVAADAGASYSVVGYVNLFRFEGAGNLRSLLVKLARDPCMMIYLDGHLNTRTAPNENFAREFWELFTLGADNGYTQDDIVQAAKAFTGYRTRTDSATGLVSVVFDPNRHDTGSKTFLGRTVLGQNAGDDFQAVVDITVDNRAVAEFITKKLYAHFANDAPPQELVDAMAAHLRANGYELGPFLKAMLRSEAFFSTASRKSLVKNPVDFTLGFIQTTGLKIQVSTLASQLSTLAQVPTQPPSVNGWPLGDLWLSAQNMADRMNAVYLVVEDTTRQTTGGMNVANVLPPLAERTPANVVDSLAALLRVDLTAGERQTCIDYLNTAVSGSGTAPVATPSPFDGSSQSHLDTRVRGLLYILAQHPSYQIR